MGYSIAVVPRSEELGQKMVAFFSKHYQTWGQLGGWGIQKDAHRTYASCLMHGPLEYDNRTNVIGFDYKPAWREREYVHSLVAWIAIQIGERHNGFPCYWYDNDERIELTPAVIDEDGWYTSGHASEPWSGLADEYAEMATLVKPELSRLTKLWEVESNDAD